MEREREQQKQDEAEREMERQTVHANWLRQVQRENLRVNLQGGS